MKYAIEFEFLNENGEWRKDRLTNNGKGLPKGDAEEIHADFIQRPGHRNVRMVPLRKVQDGWHTICGHDVYVEDGIIRRGVEQRSPLNIVPVYPYRYHAKGNRGWWREDMTVDAFRAGVKRGTVNML